VNNRYLTKLARSEVKEHQQRILDKLDKGSMIAAHSMGSGKTLTALLAAEKAQKDFPDEHVTAIVPASLVNNMNDQIKEHGVVIDPNRFHVTTYDKAVNDIHNVSARKHSLVIVDEAHRLRNKGTMRSSELDKVLKTSRKNLLLTGTPSYNKPEDIAVLVNKAAGGKILPDDAKGFEERFIGRRKVDPGFLAKHVLGVKPGEVTYLKNQGELRDSLRQYVDTYDAQNTNAEDFPTVTHHTVKVDMDKDQQRIYKFLEEDVPAPVRWKIRLGLPLSKKESSDLNAFSTGIRQASNNIKPYVPNPDSYGASPKQRKMADSIQERLGSDKNYRGISYSNYLESGLRPLSKELNDRGIANSIYDGSLSAREKDAMVEDYNSGKVKQLLVSSSGAEGLNTKGTKLVQIMEPHFNKSKIDQVVARGVRFKSHAHLPDNERHVDVEHYHSTMPTGMIDKIVGRKTSTIDEYLTNASEQKDKVKNDIMNLVKQSSDREDNIRIAGGVGGAAVIGGGVGATTNNLIKRQINHLENQNLKYALEAHRMHNWVGARSPETLLKDHAHEAAMWTKSDLYERASDKLRNLHRPAVTGAVLAAGLSGGVIGSGFGRENTYLGKAAEYDSTQGAVRGALIGAGTTGAAVGGMAHMLLSKQIGKADNESWRYAMQAFNQPKSMMYTPEDKKVFLEAANSYAKRAEGLRALYKPIVLGGAAYGVIVGAARGATIGADNKYLSKVAAYEATTKEDLVRDAISGTLQGAGFEALNRRFKWMPKTSFGTAAGIGIGSNVVVESGLRHAENKYLGKIAEQGISASDAVANRLTNPVAMIAKLDQVGTPATKAGTIALGMYMAANKGT